MRSDESYAAILALSVVWGALAARVRGARARRLLGLVPGTFLCGLFGLWHAPLGSAGLYALLARTPRRTAGLVAFAYAFSCQLALRLRLVPGARAGLDGLGNGLYLVLTLRHASVGAEMADAAAPADAAAAAPPPTRAADAPPQQTQQQPPHPPPPAAVPSSLFEFLSYSLSFYGLFTGPVLTYAQHEAGLARGAAGAAAGRGGAAAARRAALGAAGRACAYGAAYLALRDRTPFVGYVGTAAFAAAWPRPAARLAYCFVAVAQYRFRFYLAWAITEAAGRLAFGPPTPRLQSRPPLSTPPLAAGSSAGVSAAEAGLDASIANVHVPTIELATRARARVRAWNSSATAVLYSVVYRRLRLRLRWWADGGGGADGRAPPSAHRRPRGGGGGGGGAERALRVLATFLVSAVWHDTAPITPKYYLYFLHLPLLAAASDVMGERVYARLPRAAAPLVWAYEVSAFNYFSSAFVAPSSAQLLAVWRAHYWLGHAHLLLAAAVEAGARAADAAARRSGASAAARRPKVA